ncbi:glutamate--tRNA ligase [Candidatus Aerophobetes bacterium Ae_b3a]|nr:MAG: glutamate--tRNA ligase [Candidatus Aerophobetes bacterium Ae_b3a]
MKEEVRVRFAPSPTGELHIGGARTALFNWLFARHNEGKLILRIEDTDVVRSRKNFSKSAMDSLRWLGLDWDEGPGKEGDYGPYFQSQRLSIYQKYAGKLIEEKKAYLCYCTQEELEESNRKMRAKNELPRYDGRCRTLSPTQMVNLEEKGRLPSIRFKVPEKGITYVEDLLRGKVSFSNEMMGDFIILKSNKTPAFNFANVIDDALMRITCVIRGDDHLSNTPRQILLYKALNFENPQYVHIPMILGKDGAKLSKRHAATSVSSYRKEGYLPWALVNYLALLGWSTADSQQFFEKEELIEKFSLDKVGKSAAIFDSQKLEWMNGEYIRRMNWGGLWDRFDGWWRIIQVEQEKQEKRANMFKEVGSTTTKMAEIIQVEQEKQEKRANMFRQFREDPDKMAEIIPLVQPRIKVFSDIFEQADFFFEKDFNYDSTAVDRRLKKDYVPSLLKEIRKRIEQLSAFREETLEGMARNLSKDFSLTTGQVFHPLRVSLTGKMKGPGLFELAVVLGKKEVLRRIDRTLEMLRKL